jgi:hypothetical protein
MRLVPNVVWVCVHIQVIACHITMHVPVNRVFSVIGNCCDLAIAFIFIDPCEMKTQLPQCFLTEQIQKKPSTIDSHTMNFSNILSGVD